MAIPTLLPDESTLHGHWDPARPPVLTVAPGTTVRFRTLDSGWSTGANTAEALAVRPRHPAHDAPSGHALTGPVEVSGAEPGQVLAVRIDDVVPGTFGTTYCVVRSTALNERLGVTAAPVVHRWTLDPVARIGRNQSGALRRAAPVPRRARGAARRTRAALDRSALLARREPGLP